MRSEINDYLSGVKLYGDDFTQSKINEWYADEEEGYANLGAKNRDEYQYEYHALNTIHGFRFLKQKTFTNALGLGSAYGDEFTPIASKIGHITILDPSDAFSNIKNIAGTPCEYVKPHQSGSLSFESNSFELITSFGALHHIPNVSHILSECYRCLQPNGIMLIREPISTMGDWRFPREGLTKHERGIPVHLFDKIILNAHFTIIRKTLCQFSPLSRIASRLGINLFNNPTLTHVDAVISKMLSRNPRYHRKNVIQKIAPGSVFYVLSK
jgi:ubiquinone/menaquinone biosynthesis C-methylase UbiE